MDHARPTTSFDVVVTFTQIGKSTKMKSIALKKLSKEKKICLVVTLHRFKAGKLPRVREKKEITCIFQTAQKLYSYELY